MAIDVGAAAINRDSNTTDGYTTVGKENPANESGTIDHIEIFMYAAGNVTIASFEEVGENTFTARGNSGVLTTVEGLNIFDAPGDFTAFAIEIGDYIGVYTASGTKVDKVNAGDGYWYDFGDKTSASEEIMTWLASRTLSLYGTGGAGVDVTVTPSAIAMTEILKAPSLLYDYTITPSALTLTGVLKAPTIITGVDITISPDAITITAILKSPSMLGDAIISPSVLALTGIAKLPSVLLDCIISVSALALTGTLKAPTIVLAADVTITPDAIVLTLVILDPRVGTFDGIYEEEQRLDTAYIELTKPSTIYTELW